MANLSLGLELDALRDLFKNAWQFLKTRKVLDLPWYWVIGTNHSGKTFFIKQGQLKLIPTKDIATNPQDETENHKRCNWWVCEQAILVDIPGSYLTTATKDGINWQYFLSIAQQFLANKPLTGIILTLNLAEWGTFTKTQQQDYAQQLRSTFLLLQKKLKQTCPVYLVLTHLDKIAGFVEFFGDLGHEEQQQAWGFNLIQSAFANDLSLPKLFKTRFDQLLNRLYTRVIWRTQQERLIEKHALIQHFPWQLESLKESLTNLLYHLGDVLALSAITPLQGVYLVSNLQQGTIVDCIPKAPQGELIPFSQATVTYSKQRTAYFSQQLWHKVILANDTIAVKATQKTRFSAFFYLAAAGLVLSSSLIMAHSFNSKVNQLNTAEIALANYRLLAKQLPITAPNLNQVLPALNSFEHAVALLNQVHLPWLIQDLHRPNSLDSVAEKTYHQTLIHYFLPSLSTLLQPILNNTNDPTLLYGALKIYLMLGDPEHLDVTAMKNWFGSYWGITLSHNPELQKKLLIHLNALLAKPIPPLVLNQQLIIKARYTLNATPNYQLAYGILKNENNNGSISPLQFVDPAFNKVFTTFGKMPEIPNLYTAKQFQNIYFEQIQKACMATDNGNWVIGSLNHPELSAAEKQLLIEKVRIQYLQDYARYWQILLINIAIGGWQNWQQAHDVLTLLANKPIIINQTLTIISDNTSTKQLICKNIASQDLHTIQTYLTNQFSFATESTNKMHDAIVQLNRYLDDIVNNRDSNKSAFVNAKARFSGSVTNDPVQQVILVANALPQPLQEWLNSLASNAWRLILEHSEQYINQTWQAEIVKLYSVELNNRYPLVKTSRADINPADFTRFFGPNGNIDRYFKDYLAPFIDTSQTQWSYRMLNGQTINLGDNFLRQLERAALIRAMFFGKDQQLAVTFSLQPQAFEPGVKSITISLNGQTIEDLRDEITSPHFFTWPGSAKQQTATLIFLNDQGGKTTKTEFGPWAFFRLLDQANLQTISDTKNFQLTFDLNGNAVRYQLFAVDPINPFIPGIVEGFRCPLELKRKSRDA